MLRAILISPDPLLNQELTSALAQFPDVEVVRIFSDYPVLDELLRTLRVRKPDFMFFSVGTLSQLEDLAAQLDELMPNFPIVAIGRNLQPGELPKLMHLGIREYLSSPIEHARVGEVLDSIQRQIHKHPLRLAGLGDLYSFLPAKPGVGCSTLAVSTSCALADDLGARTLLIDCDFAAGPIRFLLKMGNTSSLRDALAHAPNLDEDIWSHMIGKWDKLAVLHVGDLLPPPVTDLLSLQSVLSIARAQYEVICADLPSNLDDFTVSVMRESRRIFVVTTPEVVPLHFAAERVRSLKKLGLDERVGLLLNRKTGHRGGVDEKEVARLVGMPVEITFSNDYEGVGESILKAGPVARESPLGQSILNLAQSLAPHLRPKETAKQRKFLEFFHVARAEEPHEVWSD